MGLVYRAYHVQLERTGAVKVLQSMAPDPDTTARFRHEAQAIAQMRHPNIVNVYDFGEYQGTPYMIVEYVPGGSLADRLGHGRLHHTKTLHYLRGIAAGLDYAHELAIVHRDVKPANVLLEKDDTPVLADFGLAKLLRGTSLKSMTGVTTGTPAYMAPEQVTGSNVGPPADRYSLATIAYEMLTGVIPFDGEGIIELLYAQVHREPMPPSARDATLGAQVDAVIMRGLSKDPAARWESCAAFIDALTEALAADPDQAIAKTMVLAPGVAPTMKLVTSIAPPLAKRRSRKGLIALAVAAALLAMLIVGGAGYLAMNPRPSVSLSPSTVAAGGIVVVTAAHVPANQDVEIQLLSTIHTFPFHTGAGSNLTASITVPRNIGAGDHTVKICWASACYASAALRVFEPVAAVITSPGTTPTGTSAPTTNPTSAPTRGPTPSAAPAASPSPTPTPTPIASPTPTPSPSPLPARSITLSSTHFNLLGGSTTVTGSNFSPGTTATITFTRGGTTKQVTAPVGSSGAFTQTLSVPGLLVAGSATITACDPNGCAPTQTVQVTAL
jgi:serine/threonine-protein kinase